MDNVCIRDGSGHPLVLSTMTWSWKSCVRLQSCRATRAAELLSTSFLCDSATIRSASLAGCTRLITESAVNGSWQWQNGLEPSFVGSPQFEVSANRRPLDRADARKPPSIRELRGLADRAGRSGQSRLLHDGAIAVLRMSPSTARGLNHEIWPRSLELACSSMRCHFSWRLSAVARLAILFASATITPIAWRVLLLWRLTADSRCGSSWPKLLRRHNSSQSLGTSACCVSDSESLRSLPRGEAGKPRRAASFVRDPTIS